MQEPGCRGLDTGAWIWGSGCGVDARGWTQGAGHGGLDVGGWM